MKKVMTAPLISIIIPTFNRSGLLRESLNSILIQTNSNWECIIVDDGSTDNTEENIKDFLSDDRISFFKRPGLGRKGASACRNYGLKMSKGEYIQFLDSDDLLKENKLEEQLKILKTASSYSVVTCKFGSFSSSAKLLVKTQYNSYNNFQNSLDLLYTFGKYNEYFPLHVYLIPRKLINKIHGWNEELSYNDDGEYFTRLLTHSSQVIFCDSTEVYYRAGDQNRLSTLDSEEKLESALKSWRLIEDHLTGISKKICSKYVRNGKKNIREQLKGSQSSLIRKYNDSEGFGRNWIQKIYTRLKYLVLG